MENSEIKDIPIEQFKSDLRASIGGDIPRRHQNLFNNKDIEAMFEIMNILNNSNPELYKATTKKIEENGGAKTLFSSGPINAANLIHKYLITSAKEIANLREKKTE